MDVIEQRLQFRRMPLVVRIVGESASASSPRGDYISFPSEAVYWYLRRFLKAADPSALVDLYSWSEFKLEELPVFLRHLDEARREVTQQPGSWSVEIGKRFHADHVESVRESVSRAEVMSTVIALTHLAQDAIRSGTGLVFIGD
jgi:hypothetical protein